MSFFASTLRRALALALVTLLAGCGGGGGSGSGDSGGSSGAPAASAARPSAPTIQSSAATVYTGQSISFTGSATDPGGLTLTYLWDFGDGATSSGTSTTHTYAAAGNYSVTLTVTNSAGGSSSGSIAQGVISTASNALVADCAGSGCGASATGSSYSGSGAGVWRYSNTNATDATVNLNIAGVSQGKTVTLLFSNGNNAAVTSVPNAGTLGLPLASPAPSPYLSSQPAAVDEQAARDAAHDELLNESRKLAQRLVQLRQQQGGTATAMSASPLLAAPAASAAPAIGTTRSWYVSFNGVSGNYATAVDTTCAVSTGRNVVVWLDPNATSAGIVTASDITSLTNAFCGASGGYSQLAGLIGDAWGSAASQFSGTVIQDSPALQDINIVIVDPLSTAGWAGYFAPSNNFLKTATNPNSNEALVFFINANQVKANLNYTISALLHEATHMINFYQRAVVRGTYHDTWLEETSAMMTEDIVVPGLLSGYDTVRSARLPKYLATGGAVSYVTWPTLSGPNYALGGAFGSFLNRRYGLAIFKQLVTSCTDGKPNTTSYGCLDTLIQSNGGLGFADEFAHFGATVFAALPPAGVPFKYGFPARSDGGYSLGAIDVSAFVTLRPATAAALTGGYTATTHTYQVDVVPAGKTTYVRNGVVVPANTTLLVVVQ